MPKKKRVWTEEHFRAVFKDMGAKVPKKGTPNPTMHTDLVELLKSRDAKADVEERLNNLFDIADKDLAKPVHKEEDDTSGVISNCETFGKGYNAKAEACINCEDGAEVAALCKEKTAAFKKDAKVKDKKVSSMNTRRDYASLAELQEDMRKAPDNKITRRLDKLLVEGKLRFSTIVKKMAEARVELSTPEKEIIEYTKDSRIRAHIKYRESHNKWIFAWEGEKKDIPKVIGVGEVQVEPPVEKQVAVG